MNHRELFEQETGIIISKADEPYLPPMEFAGCIDYIEWLEKLNPPLYELVDCPECENHGGYCLHCVDYQTCDSEYKEPAGTCDDFSCSKCNGTGKIKKWNYITVDEWLWKDCEHCEGSGRELDDTCKTLCERYQDKDWSECNSHARCPGNACPHCENGKVPTGRTLLDDSPMWKKHIWNIPGCEEGYTQWSLHPYNMCRKYDLNDEYETMYLVIALPWLPKPPADWRPE